jgi:hypothetical protein
MSNLKNDERERQRPPADSLRAAEQKLNWPLTLMISGPPGKIDRESKIPAPVLTPTLT